MYETSYLFYSDNSRHSGIAAVRPSYAVLKLTFYNSGDRGTMKGTTRGKKAM